MSHAKFKIKLSIKFLDAALCCYDSGSQIEIHKSIP